MKLTIHIGAHKTGSTAIQQYCEIARAQLAARSVIYPTGIFERFPAQHSELARILGPHDGDELAACFSRIAAAAHAAGAEQVLLSGEDLCTAANEAQIRRLAAEATRHFEQTRIVLVLRRKRDYVFSHYRHVLRHAKDGVGAQEFRKRVNFNPAATLQRWQSVLGADNVTVLAYESADGRPLLVRFFSDLLGIVPDPAALAACERVNASMDMLTTFLVNDVLKALPELDVSTINRAYLRTFGRGHHRVPFLERDIADMVDALYPDTGWDVGPAHAVEDASARPAPLSESEARMHLGALGRFVELLLAGGDPGAAGELARGALSRRDVIEAYRVLLDRLPENERVVEAALTYRDMATLRDRFLASPEYRRKNPRGPMPLDGPPLDVRLDGAAADTATLVRLAQSSWPLDDLAHMSDAEADVPAGSADLPGEALAAIEREGIDQCIRLERIMARAGRQLAGLTRAGELGCGPGGLSIQLARTTGEVAAWDPLPRHVDIARSAAAQLGVSNIAFQIGLPLEARTLARFDLWYSRRALQYCSPPLIEALLRMMLASLGPGGMAVVQLPTYAIGYTFDAARPSAPDQLKIGGPLHCLPQARVFALAEEADCAIREVREDDEIDDPKSWVSNTFVIQRRGS